MQARARCNGGGSLRLGFMALLLLVTILCPVFADPGDKKLVSLDFVAADIHDVLKAMSVQSGINIVAGNDVKGIVTISLANVSLTEALDYITKVSGLSYRTEGNAYIVASPTSLRAMFGNKNQVTEVVEVPNGQAVQVQSVISKAVPDASIQAQGDKMLVVCGLPDDISTVRELVAKLDTKVEPTESEVTETYRVRYIEPKSAVEMLAKLVPQVKCNVGPNYGFSWYVKANVGSGGDSSSSGDDKPKVDSDLLILVGYPSAIAAAREILAKIDVSPIQLIVEAKVMVVDRSDLSEVGIDWEWDSSNWRASSEGIIQFGKLDGTPAPFFAQLDALITNGKSRLLASPKIATISNRPADIFIGDTILYPVTQLSSSGIPTVTIESVDVGIGLKLAAVANNDGNITLCITTHVSTIRDYLKIGDSLIPQISTRQAQTAVRVKNGDPILIGGLLRDEDIKNVKRLPILSDLPLLGNLFKDTSVTKKQTEIMVFLTPKLLDDTHVQAALPGNTTVK